MVVVLLGASSKKTDIWPTCSLLEIGCQTALNWEHLSEEEGLRSPTYSPFPRPKSLVPRYSVAKQDQNGGRLQSQWINLVKKSEQFYNSFLNSPKKI